MGAPRPPWSAYRFSDNGFVPFLLFDFRVKRRQYAVVGEVRLVSWTPALFTFFSLIS